jgi:hypothetical protein
MGMKTYSLSYFISQKVSLENTLPRM